MSTLEHSVTPNSVRARKAHLSSPSRRLWLAVPALCEVPAGHRYRAQFGARGLSADDLAAMRKDSGCPVHRRAA